MSQGIVRPLVIKRIKKIAILHAAYLLWKGAHEIEDDRLGKSEIAAIKKEIKRISRGIGFRYAPQISFEDTVTQVLEEKKGDDDIQNVETIAPY